MRLTFMWLAVRATVPDDVQDGPETAAQRRAVEPDRRLFPWNPPTRLGGRPRIPPRACFEGILWVLRSGARWKDLTRSFPSLTTFWRRFK